jgi:hypothetical protein
MIRKSMLWLSAALMAAGVSFLSTDSASAQWGRYRDYGHTYRNYDYHNHRYGNYGYRYSYPRHGTHYDWHDTSHYDYHPPSIRWHGNHIDVTPGHYDYHRQGHWDRH